MPIMYVNPAPKGARRSKKVRRVKRIARVAKMGSTSRRRKSAAKRKNAASRRATKKKGTHMARKLFGAAAKAHAKRLAKLHRKHKRKSSKKSAAPKRKRRKKSAAVAAAPKHKRRKARKAAAAPAPKRRRRKAHKAHKARKGHKRSASSRRAAARRARRSGIATLRRARRIIRRSPRKILNRRTARYVRKYKMHSNPRRGRRGRRRRNPSGGLMGTPTLLMGALKSALPVAASLYLTRFIIAKIGPSIPMVDRLGAFQKPAVAGLMVVAANFGTKKGPLAKYRSGIMLGTSLNLVDTLIQAFAPSSIKSMFGLGDSGLYDQALGEFVTVGDYMEVGDGSIDDDITLSDYVETSGVEEELGALQEELGVEEELGGEGPRRLGGVSQTSLMRGLKQSSSVGVVPQRSFVKQVPHAGAGYDNPASLYTGIFGGGW